MTSRREGLRNRPYQRVVSSSSSSEAEASEDEITTTTRTPVVLPTSSTSASNMDSELRNMVMAFRVTELQNLLNYASKNKSGRKNELQARALELVKAKQTHVVMKIRELYRSIQLSNLNQPAPASAGVTASNQNYAHHNNAMVGRMFSSYAGAAEKVLQGHNPYNNYNGTQSRLPGLQALNLPICPDVRMKLLPFYDILAEVHKPSSLISQSSGRALEANFPFCLTPSQAADIAASKDFSILPNGEHKIQYTVQVQMRFCALDITCPQEDAFPPALMVKVNNKLVQLPHPIPSNRPGVEAKRPSRPLNVTNFVKLSPTCTNNVLVNWGQDMSGRGFAMSLYLVKKLNSRDLMARLKSKGPRPAEYTKGMIKELVRKDDADCIATTSFKVSIACPLGKCRMNLPCRASTCKHLQCFDANLFLQMNEKKPTWSCPVCDKETLFENIALDGYFQDVISKMQHHDGNDIEVLPDGTWTPMEVKKESDEPPTKRMKAESSKKANETICLDDDLVICEDDDDDIIVTKREPVASEKEKEKPKAPPEFVDLTLSSDEEEEATGKSDSSEEVIRKPKSTRSKPTFMIDDSSSSSSSSASNDNGKADPPKRPTRTTSNSSSSRPASASGASKATGSSSGNNDEVANPPSNSAKPNTRPVSPDCIVLDDSPTPSPEPRQSTKTTGVTAPFNSNYSTGSTNNEASDFSSLFSNDVTGGSLDLPYGSVGQVGFSGIGNNTRRNTPPGISNGFDPMVGYSSNNQYMPFDNRNTWDSSTSYPAASDFSSLDYPSMDFFNQGPSYNNRPGGSGGTGGGGSNSGYGTSRW